MAETEIQRAYLLVKRSKHWRVAFTLRDCWIRLS